MDRRAFIAGSGAALTLPLFRPGRAEAQVAPKRLVVIFTANGTIPSAFFPTGTETGFTFGPILQPLDAFKPKMAVLKGLTMKSRGTGPGNGHTQGIGHLLTGAPLLTGTLLDGGGRPSGYASHISIDQSIANAIATGTRMASLQLGVRVLIPETPVRARLSYAGPNQPLVPNDDPYNVFDQLFGSLAGTPAQQMKIIAQRKSVLDNSLKDINRLMGKLGTDDRERLQSHTGAIRSIEAALRPNAAGCNAPTLETARLNPKSSTTYPTMSQYQMRLLAAAFACDITRVATVLYNSSQSAQNFPWLGINTAHHNISHEPDGNAVAQDQLLKINTWYATQVKTLLDELAKYPEGPGKTVLDNTLVVWANEIGVGNSHTQNNIPILLAGGPVGGLRLGRFITYNNLPLNNLWVSLGRAFGVGMDTFGDRRFCTGALPNLT